ncbi:transglycosylase SLT domain-containing protein, partial [Limosilactobacillus reuteri]|nr:transglycosylase SLT domain-containing protein [Limosilactobacillus reuteri]
LQIHLFQLKEMTLLQRNFVTAKPINFYYLVCKLDRVQYRQRNINFPKYLGEVTGGVIGLVTAFKILKGTVNGLSALKQDFLSLFRINKENDKIKLENHELERNVALWKEHNLVSGGDSAIGNSIEIPSKEKGAASKIEKAERDVQIRPYLDETRSSRISRWFSNVLPDFGKKGGEKAGAKASTGFLSKFKSLPNLIKKAGIFGSIIDFGIVALTALDLSKNIYSGLTNSKAKSRYKDAGKSIAEGIGWYLAGPFGGQLASLGTDWAYKTTDSFKKGWNGYTKNYKPRGFVATVGWDFKDATRKYNNWIATIEKKHPVIAGYFRWERGTFNTAFATLKFFARNVHAGLKEMWDTVADLSTGHMKRWKSDMGRDARSMIKGVKDDWRGFFDWFGKNRQKETIHKPTRKQSGSSTTDTHKSTSENKVKSLGNTRYSKSDVQNLKAMTAQIGLYEKALKGLKSVIKTNDPTAELRHMNSELKGASSNWGKVAKPIKEIGDAFKYLSQFTNSMAKKDAFAAFNDDLPKLDGTVKKYGKSLIKNIDSLGKSLKNNSLEKPLKKISSEIKDSTKKWKEFASPVKSLSKSFKTLQNATKTLVGKNGLEATKKGFTDLNNALKKQKIGAYIKKLAGDLKKSKVTTYLTRMDKSVKNSAKYWRSLAKPLKSLAGSFNTLQKSVRGLNGKKTGFTALNSDIRNLYRTIRKNPFGRLIAQQANIANKAMSGKKSGFVNEFNRQTRSMDRALRSFKREFDRDWRSTWSGLDRPVSRNLGSASRSVDRYLDDIQSTRSKFSSSFLKGWDSWIDDVVSNFRKGFDKLPGYAQSSMKDIISRLNKGISGINSTISNFGGDKKLSTISYANGTNGGHPGGHMLVNDSVRPHWKELVLFPNGQALLPQHRNTLIPNAPRGTQVLSGESTYKFMNSIGVHKYANGTLSDEEMEKLSEKFEKNPNEAAKELVLKFTNWSSKTPIVANLGEASAVGFARGIANVLKDQMAEMSNPPGSGVARWRPVVLRALSMLGLSSGLVDKVLRQIDTESKGDPHAHQPGADPDGDGSGPALGLMQTKRGTFNANAVGNHRDIWNGFDNILAGLNYAMKRYGKGLSALGNGHGYANGGLVVQHGLYEIAEQGLPEAIIPLDINKRPRALSLIDHTLDKMEQDGGGTGGLRSRRAQSQSSDETTAYLKQAVTFLAQIVGLNKQQIDAILANGSDNISARRKRAQFYSSYGKDQKLNDYMSY